MFDVNFLSMQCGLGKLGRLWTWTAPGVKPAPSPGTSRHFPRTFIKMSAPQFLLLFIDMNSFRALFFVSAGVTFLGALLESWWKKNFIFFSFWLQCAGFLIKSASSKLLFHFDWRHMCISLHIQWGNPFPGSTFLCYISLSSGCWNIDDNIVWQLYSKWELAFMWLIIWWCD